MSGTCVIINPNAAKGRAAKKKPIIEATFRTHGIEAVFYETAGPGDAEKLALKACREGFDTVVAAGGDGCVNEVVNGIMKSGAHPSMGIIPLGRGNDFAWIAKIPTDLEAAVRLIAKGSPSKIDVGYLEGGVFPDGRYFLNGTGFGFEPAINFKAAEYRHLNGMASYVVAFFHCLVHLPPAYELTVTIDGEAMELSSQQVSVCNGRRMGSAFILAPHGILDDGLIDIVYAKHPVRRRDVIPMVLNFFRGTQLEKCSFMEEKRGREVDVVCHNGGMKIHTDGELVGLDAKSCSIRLLPSAIDLHRG